MSTTPQIPAGLLRAPMVDSSGMLTAIWQRWLTDTMTRTVSSLTLQGQITPTTPIEGRPEPLAQTVQNVDANGVVTANGVDLSRAYVNKTVDNVNDGTVYKRTTGVQVTGAGRAAVAIDPLNNVVSAHVVPAIQLNFTSQATVAPKDAGLSAGVDIYGPGGAGTAWTGQLNGASAGPYPSFSVSGLAYLSTFIAYYDTVNAVGVIRTVPATEDYFVYAGTFKTPASGGGSVATATAIMAGISPNETVQSVNVTGGGSGYTSAPSVVFNGGGTPSTVATGYATVSGGAVTAIVITNGGAGYSSTPTISFAGGQGGVSGGGGTSGTVAGRGSLAGVLSQ